MITLGETEFSAKNIRPFFAKFLLTDSKCAISFSCQLWLLRYDTSLIVMYTIGWA